jgi:hypothetical protein
MPADPNIRDDGFRSLAHSTELLASLAFESHPELAGDGDQDTSKSSMALA